MTPHLTSIDLQNGEEAPTGGQGRAASNAVRPWKSMEKHQTQGFKLSICIQLVYKQVHACTVHVCYIIYINCIVCTYTYVFCIYYYVYVYILCNTYMYIL